MKLLEQQGDPIDFHGLTLHVENLSRYSHISADEGGEVYVYSSKPSRGCVSWLHGNSLSQCRYIAEVDLEGMDWRDTLMEIPK